VDRVKWAGHHNASDAILYQADDVWATKSRVYQRVATGEVNQAV
jgi:hypothetical protein